MAATFFKPGCLALAVNSLCLLLLSRHHRRGVHMWASMIYSTNYNLATLGVIVTGLLVTTSWSWLTDHLIGGVIARLVGPSGNRILRVASAD